MMIVMMMTYLNWKIAKLFWGDNNMGCGEEDTTTTSFGFD